MTVKEDAPLSAAVQAFAIITGGRFALCDLEPFGTVLL